MKVAIKDCCVIGESKEQREKKMATFFRELLNFSKYVFTSLLCTAKSMLTHFLLPRKLFVERGN
jgi:hypothetical protein